MKITGLKCLHADAGCRNFDFLKITTDEGIIGWSEFNESFGGMGFNKFVRVIIGLVFMVFGFLLMLVDLSVIVPPGDFVVNTILLQVVLIVYSVYLFIGAWMQ